MNLNLMQIEDIPCTSEAIRRLTILGREEMPDVVRIADFDYHPLADDFKVASEGAVAREAFENDKATPTAQDPLVAP